MPAHQSCCALPRRPSLLPPRQPLRPCFPTLVSRAPLYVLSCRPQKESSGYKLLSKMGWREGEGLGASKQGIKSHIKVKKKFENWGVGAVSGAEGATQRGGGDAAHTAGGEHVEPVRRACMPALRSCVRCCTAVRCVDEAHRRAVRPATEGWLASSMPALARPGPRLLLRCADPTPPRPTSVACL